MDNTNYTYIVKCGGNMGKGVVVSGSFTDAMEAFLDMRPHLRVGAELVMEAVLTPTGPDAQSGGSNADVPSPTLGVGSIIERISRITTAALERRMAPMVALREINTLLG